MEQVQTKQKSLALPVAALICAIDGYIGGVATYLLLLETMVFPALRRALMPALPRLLGLMAIVFTLQCTVGLVLGIIGLVRSVRRPRRIDGIVTGAIAVLHGVSCYGLLVAMQTSWYTMTSLNLVRF